MSYDVLGPGPLDYLPCRYGASRLLFRGPKRDLEAPYLAFIGSSETYGKFIEFPFPALVETQLGMTCANFGQLNAGIDAFTFDPFVMQAAKGAEITVIQVLGAQNMTNRFYSVHPRRNDRFLEAASLLKTIFREVDFSDFHFNKHMLTALLETSPDRFQAVRQELQEAWKARMRHMLKQIRSKTILLWVSERGPDDVECLIPDEVGIEPLFITRDMIEDIRPFATAVVEVVISDEALDAGTAGMKFSEMEAAAAERMYGPQAHEEVAGALSEAIEILRAT